MLRAQGSGPRISDEQMGSSLKLGSVFIKGLFFKAL